MNRRHFLGAAAVLLTLLGLSSAAQTVDVNDQGVALEGYDPVAYFTRGRAVRGSARFSARHNGVTYYFSNAHDRTIFLSQPGSYAPRYGGFCAYGAAHGMKLSGDPGQWEIVDGKLYLMHNQATMQAWKEDKPRYISQADAIWARILVRLASGR